MTHDQVLTMVETGQLEVGGTQPQKLCLVAVCYHNIAVEQLILIRVRCLYLGACAWFLGRSGTICAFAEKLFCFDRSKKPASLHRMLGDWPDCASAIPIAG